MCLFSNSASESGRVEQRPRIGARLGCGFFTRVFLQTIPYPLRNHRNCGFAYHRHVVTGDIDYLQAASNQFPPAEGRIRRVTKARVERMEEDYPSTVAAWMVLASGLLRGLHQRGRVFCALEPVIPLDRG